MAGNEHAKPALEEVRRILLARAAELGLNGEDDDVIERLLESEVPKVELSEEDCRSYYERNARRFSSGELVEASHILLAVTPRVPPERLRAKAAEVHALAVRETARQPARFAELARQYSNCPSARVGGTLGQIGRADVVPELAPALFDGERLGVLPELASSRFGFHVLLVARRIAGRLLPYEAARPQVEAMLAQLGAERALGEYVRALAARRA